MPERTDTILQRVTYSMTPLEVERAIIDSLSEEYGPVFNDATIVQIDKNGFATVRTEYPCKETP
jgi:hypothetical protein